MLRVKFTTLIFCLGMILCFDSLMSTSYAQWYASYKNGLNAMKRKNWTQAIDHFQDALRVKSKDKKKIRAKGVMFIEYYPNREIGICYFNLGQIERAKFHLAISVSQHATRRAKTFLKRINKGDYPKNITPPADLNFVRDRRFREEQGQIMFKGHPVIFKRGKMNKVELIWNNKSFSDPRSFVVHHNLNEAEKKYLFFELAKRQFSSRQPSNRRRPTEPAQLSVDLFFVDPSNNGFLDAEESGKIIVDVANGGRGDAFDLQVRLTPQTDISGIVIGRSPAITHLAAGKQQSVVIPISCSQSVSSKQVKLKVEVSERNGFDLDPPGFVTFNTKSLKPPEFIIADIGIDDHSQNSRIEPREIVDITARIKNIGQGEARFVKAAVRVGENVFLTPDSKTEFTLGNLRTGQFKDVSFTVFTNSKATSVPIDIILQEARGRYDKTLPLELPFNKPQRKGKDLVVTGAPDLEPEDFFGEALSSDVDTGIPKSKNENADAIAVILGVEQYKSIPNVTFAKRDATIFKEYATRVLGVPDNRNQIYFKTDYDVTKAEFLKLFTGRSWLERRVRPNSDVYVYFAGHGAPDVKDKSPYLIPSDGDANYPAQTGFSLNQLYEGLSNLNARSVTVFIDACFSGGTRENTMLLADARPLLIKIEDPVLLSEKLVCFSAASGHEISSGYPAQKHGLFTYFLLKGLRGDADKNNDRAITVQELEEYLGANVTRTAGLLDREQTPQVTGRNKQRELVRF